MKFINVSTVVFTSFLSSTCLFAGESAVDLQDLHKRWDSVAKTDAADSYLSLETVRIEGQSISDHLLRDLKEKSADKKITKLELHQWSENARNKVLSKLIPNGRESFEFCKSFPEVPVKEDAELSSEESASKYEKAQLRSCKSKIKDMLGGILHSKDIPVYFGEVVFENGDSDFIFYVGSLMNKNSFNKYSFHQD